MGGQEEATRQGDNIRPPRRGGVLAVTVDQTARPYDLSAPVATVTNVPLPWPTFRGGQDGAGDHVFIHVDVAGNDVFAYFSATTQNDLNDATVDAAGTTPLTLATTHGQRWPAGTSQEFRINRQTDRWLVVKCAAGLTATLRINISSQPSAEPPAAAG